MSAACLKLAAMQVMDRNLGTDMLNLGSDHTHIKLFTYDYRKVKLKLTLALLGRAFVTLYVFIINSDSGIHKSMTLECARGFR